MDSEAYLGEIDINPSMVSFWERDPKNMRATWYLSIAYAIKAGQLTFEDLRKYYQQNLYVHYIVLQIY